jgi:hypothetical protein
MAHPHSEGHPQEPAGNNEEQTLPPLDYYQGVDPGSARQANDALFRDSSPDHISAIVNTLGGEISAALSGDTQRPAQAFSILGEQAPLVTPPATPPQARQPERPQPAAPTEARPTTTPATEPRPQATPPVAEQPRPAQPPRAAQPASTAATEERPRSTATTEDRDPRQHETPPVTSGEQRTSPTDRPQPAAPTEARPTTTTRENTAPGATASGTTRQPGEPRRPQDQPPQEQPPTTPATEPRPQATPPVAEQPRPAQPPREQPQQATQPSQATGEQPRQQRPSPQGRTRDGQPGQEQRPAPGRNGGEQQQGPATSTDVRDYLGMLRRRAADPRLDIDPQRRQVLDTAYQSLEYVLNRYTQAGHLQPDSPLEDVLNVIDAGTEHYRLQQRLSPAEYDALQRIVGVVRERGQDPGRLRNAVNAATQQQPAQPRAAQAGPQQGGRQARPAGSGAAAQPRSQGGGGAAAQGQPQPGPRPRPQDGGQAREQAPQLGPERLTETVATVAAQNAAISTNVSLNSTIRGRGGREGTPPHDGHNTFGPGGTGISEMPRHFSEPVGSRNPIYTQGPEGRKPAEDLVEAVSFTYAQEDVYEQPPTAQPQPRRGGLLGGLLGGGQRQQAPAPRRRTGTRPVMVTNPATGQEERGVRFDYTYNPNLAAGGAVQAEERLGLPEYRECQGNRTGNNLQVSTVLPESVARELHQQARQNPESVRDVVEQIVFTAGGVSREAWEQGETRREGGRDNRMKPPYERLPSNHHIYMLEPFHDQDTGHRGHIARPL